MPEPRTEEAIAHLLKAVRVLDTERNRALALGRLDVLVRDAIHALGATELMYAQCEHQWAATAPDMPGWCTRCYMTRPANTERTEA